MATHINISADTFAATYGITLGTGAEAESATVTTTVAINELIDSASAEVINAQPINHAEKRSQVDGEGPASLAISAGSVGTVSTMTVLSADVSEAPNNRARFSIQAQGEIAFTDSAGTPTDVGAEPVIGDLEIVSVEYSIAESVRRTASLENKVLVGTNGQPAARATCTKRVAFSINGRGDLPAGVALGTGNVEFKGGDTGLTLVGTLRTGERRADWNSWGVDGTNYPSAA